MRQKSDKMRQFVGFSFVAAHPSLYVLQLIQSIVAESKSIQQRQFSSLHSTQALERGKDALFHPARWSIRASQISSLLNQVKKYQNLNVMFSHQ
jgi:hypothetical protein